LAGDASEFNKLQSQGNPMRMRNALLASTAAGAALLFQVGFAAPALAQSAAALAGSVSSAAEPVMEGVVVSAKKDGSTITVSVVTDDKGHYSFPAGRLEPGHYTLGARAVGYDLDGPKVADVTAGHG
jgi:virginiamycin B lyase